MNNFYTVGSNLLSIGSSIATSVSTPNPPGAPQNLSYSNVTPIGADLQWQAPITGGIPTFYEIYVDAVLHDTIAYPTLTYTLNTLDMLTEYDVYIVAINDGGSSPNSNTVTFTTAESPDRFYTQKEWLDTQTQFSASTRDAMLARRYATNITSSGNSFLPDDFYIPASTAWSDGETWVDDYMGYKHTIVASGRRIKNCERWIINNAGIFFTAYGSGSTTRNLAFYLKGQAYNVLGGTSNVLTITVNGSTAGGASTASIDADNKANNAWFITDDIIAWVDGVNTIATRNIITGVTGSHTVTFTGSEFLNLNQSDGCDARRAYDNVMMNPEKTAYNAANPTASIDDDKVYRIFHVSSDKKRYIILVYTISTGLWSYLDSSGATTSESASTVVHTIDLNAGTSVDYLSLNPSGKRVIGNTSGQGFTYHYVDGTYVGNVYSNSNHKSIGPIKDGLDLFSEKLTGSTPDNTTLGGNSGDMYILRFDPTNEIRPAPGLKSVDLPPGDTALYAGGDQGSHNGCNIIAYAGHRDNEPQPKEIWKKQVIVMDPEYSDHPTYNSLYGKFRIAQLNVTTGGGDGNDPGAIPATFYETIPGSGLWMTGIYWHDVNVDHNGTLRNGIFYTEIQVVVDQDSFVSLNAALTASDLEIRQ